MDQLLLLVLYGSLGGFIMLRYIINGSSGLNQQNVLSQLTNNDEALQKGVHVFYAFYEREKYINNLLGFITEGLTKRQQVIIVDKIDIYEEVIEKLTTNGYKKDDIELIVFVENDTFYLTNASFDVDRSIQMLKDTVSLYLEKGLFLRIWGQVSLQMDEPAVSKLRLYESRCDEVVAESKTIIVCTYNGLIVPAYIQNEMLKTHEYFMTDDQIVLSPFYRKENLNPLSNGEIRRLQKLDKDITFLQDQNKKLQKLYDEINRKKSIIERSEKFYRNLIEELPVSIVITKNDHIVYVNHTGIKSFDSVDIQGKAFSKLFDKTTSATKNGLSEYKLLLPNHEFRYFAVKWIPTWFEGESAALYILIDLTEQKLNEKLMVRSEKLSIAGELAAGIAHEIRNPLTAIKGFVKLLEDTSNEIYLTIINDEISRIEQISSELLILAKPHSETLKVTNIVALLNNVKTLLDTQAILKNIEIEILSDRKEIYIDCEETKIRQVFINIIKNAIEVMDKGKIIILTKKLKDFVQVDVIDQGTGMSQEMLDKLGEPFFTTKEKGTGLGLMVCYKIVGNHNGKIDVTSQVGEGSTFSVTLPLSSWAN